MAKNGRWKLFLDDIRTPEDDSYLLATNVDEAKQLIAHYGMPHFISFDHDLGEDENGLPLESGYDFAKWLVSMELDGLLKFPSDFTFGVHSMNPIGAKNIHHYMKNYLRSKGDNPIDDEMLNRLLPTLRDIDGRLCIIEKKIIQEALRLDQHMIRFMMETHEDTLFDYEFEARVSYWEEDADDPFYTSNVSFKSISEGETRRHWLLDDGENHNDFSSSAFKDHPMHRETHCYLFHDLYDHAHIGWEQISKIKTILWELMPVYQYRMDW